MTTPLAVVLATGNAGKVREFGRLLGSDVEVQIKPWSIPLPEETGATFASNARLKAEAVYAALAGTAAVLADDSGLEVDALKGCPGVLSARFAGAEASDEDNVNKLLSDLADTVDRRARFVCCLCLILPDACLAGEARASEASRYVEVRGIREGSISLAPRGTDGFGYDPVFQPEGWDETLAEASPESKDEVSHRGAAARALLRALADRGVTGRGS